MFKKTVTFPLIALATVSLVACSGTKEKLGLTKKTPDEFSVVKRAPLEMPPDYTLRPPQPGAPRPQEQSPQQAARDTVFGTAAEGTPAAQSATGPDATLLSKAGAINADPSIRNRVDAETAEINKDSQPVIKKLMGASPQDAPASVVNAKQEAERLKKNQQSGQPVMKGDTPAVEN